jgi:hypothetical protein
VVVVQKHHHQQDEGHGEKDNCRYMHQNESPNYIGKMAVRVTKELLIMTPK